MRMARPGAGGRARAPWGWGAGRCSPGHGWQDLELGAAEVLPWARWSSSRYEGGTPGGEQVQWCVWSRCLQVPCPMMLCRWGGVPNVQGAEVRGVEGKLEGQEGVEGRERGQASLLS